MTSLACGNPFVGFVPTRFFGARRDGITLGTAMEQGFVPKLLVTDKLRSYTSAFRRLRLSCPHEQELRRNNRAQTLSARLIAS
jgi:hypothetical protein